ncbi:polymorphic toxin-type HINT domain-containing protein [Actinoallomurus acanthiterrae]
MVQDRGANRRTYVNADGTLTTRFYRDRINYRLPDGSWRPLDTTLVPAVSAQPQPAAGASSSPRTATAGGYGAWVEKSAQAQIGFSSYADDASFVHLAVSGQESVAFGLQGAAHVEGEARGSQITYPGVAKDTDARFEAGDGQVKERLVLRSADAPTDWTFPLSLTGLRAVADGGRIRFVDSSGQVKAVIPAGFMTDSKADPRSGEGSLSTGVTYQLITVAGRQALRVQLDRRWLTDPARVFPVTVDPTVVTKYDDRDTYVETGESGDHSGENEIKIGSYDGGDHVAKSFIGFGPVATDLKNDYILGAQVGLYNDWSDSCKAAPVYVYPITESWSVSTTTDYPGPKTGPALGRKSFAHGYRPEGAYSWNCAPGWDDINLGVAGKNLINGWTHGTIDDNGLAIGGPSTSGWKRFLSNQGPDKGDPYLAITYTKYGAAYKLASTVMNPQVDASHDGAIKVKVTNMGTDTWTPTNGFKLGYRAYDSNHKLVADDPAPTAMPSNVGPGDSVTINAPVKKLGIGKYVIEWDMYSGSTSFSSQGVPPLQMGLTVPDMAPSITGIYPPSGYVAPTTTPQLQLTNYDPDSTKFTYGFQICAGTPDKPTGCTQSNKIPARYWTVPRAALAWNTAYFWKGSVSDGTNTTTVGPVYLTTSVPQPVVTQHLASHGSATAGDTTTTGTTAGGDDWTDPQVGNYTTHAVDAVVRTAGPPLEVRRTYNSLDPRTGLAFGAGWATSFDTRLVPDGDGSGNVVVTMPDGREVRFGRNANGSFSPPFGKFATLTANGDGTWTMLDKAGARYDFAADGTLSTLTDATGLKQTFTYDGSGHLATVQNATSARTLHFTWQGGHVNSVTTDPPSSGGPVLTWTYGYDGDHLSKVCPPGGTACTQYAYDTGSHYRSAVIDSAPNSYYRLGDTTGTTATSEVDVNQGTDNGTYDNVTLGQAGALAGTDDRAAQFTGGTSYAALADNLIQQNTYISLELWFNTSKPGVLFSYQDRKMTDNPGGNFTPALYVGTDGLLRGEFWNGAAKPITSTAKVNDGTWHHVVLNGASNSQTLFLDGQQVGTLAGQINQLGMVHDIVGGGFANTGWPAIPYGTPTGSVSCLNGLVDEVAVYPRPLGVPAIKTHYQLGRQAVSELTHAALPSGATTATVGYDVGDDRVDTFTDHNGGEWHYATPTVFGTTVNATRSVTVTGPSDQSIVYSYDAINGGRVTGVQHAGEPPMTYSYDAGGFLTKITDENGHYRQMGNDARGNPLVVQTCYAAFNCQADYYTYYLNADNPLDPRNDKVTSFRDGRSSSSTDNTYLTSYSYTPAGQLSTVDLPPTPGFPNGRTIQTGYTTGTEPSFDGGTTPAGLLASQTTPGGHTTGYAYLANGDLAQVTTPTGEKIRYGYDGIGRTTSTTEISDSHPNGLTTSYAFNGLSEPTTITHPGIKNPITEKTHTRQEAFGYDDDGDVTSYTEADLTGGDQPRTTAIDYDDHDRPNKITDPTGAVTTYDRDAAGDITGRTDAGDHEYAYTYNNRNQLTQTTLRDYSGDQTTPGAKDTVLDSYSYDPAGREATHTDALGRTDTYTYYDDDRAASISRALSTGGSVVTAQYTYDKAGNLSQNATNGGTQVTNYTYDAANHLTGQVFDPTGLDQQTTAKYDADDNVSSATVSGASPDETTDYTYDAAGHVTGKSVDTGTEVDTTTWALDQTGLPISMTDPRGNVAGADATAYTTDYVYDEDGRPAWTAQPAVTVEHNGSAASSTRPVTYQGYDTYGDQTDGKDAEGNVTTSTYDQDGRPLTRTAPSYTPPGGQPISATTVYKYDDLGELISTTDPAGNTTGYDYDELGNLVQRTDPKVTGHDKAGVWVYDYDLDHELHATTDPTGATTEATYDDLGRQITETADVRNPAGTTAAYTTGIGYTLSGDVTTEKITSAASVVTTLTLDAAGDQAKSVDAYGNTTVDGHDQNGNLVKHIQPAGTVTLYGYDGAGRLITVTDNDKNGVKLRSSSLGYDPAGDPTTWTDARKNTSTFAYDAAQRLIKQVEPVTASKSITTTYGYDGNGNRTRFTDGRGNATWYTYNSWNLPESTLEPATQATPDAADRTYTTGYDRDARPATVAQPGGVTQTATYDELGDLTRETGSGAEAATPDRRFGYDLAGRRTSVGDDTFTYDDRGLLTGTSGKSGNATFGYDADGRMSSRTDASGSAGYTYDDAGRIATDTDPTTGKVLTYGYDPDSNPNSLTYGTGGATRTAGHDPLDRISTDTLKGPDGSVIASATYGYDDDDHLTSKTTTGYAGAAATTYTYDQAGRLNSATSGGTTTAYGYDDSGNLVTNGATGLSFDARNRLTSDGANTYNYAPRGTRTARTGNGTTTTSAYDAFDQLTTNGSATYGYDALGRLIDRNGVSISYSGAGNDVAADGTATYSRTASGTPTGIAEAGKKLAAVNDRHSDLVAAFDPAAPTTLTDSTAYDPFGKPTSTTGADHLNLGYQDGWTDPATGTVNMAARWYDPAAGAFTSRDDYTLDPIPDSINSDRYTYANGDPLDATDPTGHWCVVVCNPYRILSFLGTAAKWEGRANWITAGLIGLYEIWRPTRLANDDCGGRCYYPGQGGGGYDNWSPGGLYERCAGSCGYTGHGYPYGYGYGRGYGYRRIYRPMPPPPPPQNPCAVGSHLCKPPTHPAVHGIEAVHITHGSLSASSPRLTENPRATTTVTENQATLTNGATDSGMPSADPLPDSSSIGGNGGPPTPPVLTAASDPGGRCEGGLLAAPPFGDDEDHRPHSFIGSTRVLMADGTAKPISKVKPGDKVKNSKPGLRDKPQVHTVDDVIVTHTDHAFVDLTVAAHDAHGRPPGRQSHHHRSPSLLRHHPRRLCRSRSPQTRRPPPNIRPPHGRSPRRPPLPRHPHHLRPHHRRSARLLCRSRHHTGPSTQRRPELPRPGPRRYCAHGGHIGCYRIGSSNSVRTSILGYKHGSGRSRSAFDAP